MELTVTKEVQGETTILKLKGILDISTQKVIEPFITEIDSIKTLIFDFSELEFIDSTGIGSIIDSIYVAQEKNFMIELTGVDEAINDVFETVGLYHILATIQEVGI